MLTSTPIKHRVRFSETVFSFSFENFPMSLKVILKSPERSRIRQVRKEIYLSRFILQVIAKLLELFSYLNFRQLAEIHIIRFRMFLCKAFLFYQVHFTLPQPRLIASTIPQEIGLAVCREAGDRHFHRRC